MLISKKDIINTKPPFLMQAPTGDWKLVVNICSKNEKLQLELVENQNGGLITRSIEIGEVPFHVGAGVWELEYGTRLMTLNHSSFENHSAKKLWGQWLKYNAKTKTLRK